MLDGQQFVGYLLVASAENSWEDVGMDNMWSACWLYVGSLLILPPLITHILSVLHKYNSTERRKGIFPRAEKNSDGDKHFSSELRAP